MGGNRSFYSNWDWLGCLIYCCHSGEAAGQSPLLLEAIIKKLEVGIAAQLPKGAEPEIAVEGWSLTIALLSIYRGG